MGFIYTLLKDIFSLFKYKDDVKLVELNYPELKGIDDRTRWSNRDRVQRRLGQGFEVYYEYDKRLFNRKRYSFVNSSDQILLIRVNENSQD